MDCYDCLPHGSERRAVAVCRRCGAGLCAEHVHLAPETIHHVVGTGTASSSVHARRITCGVCHDAEHSQHSPVT